MNSTSLKLLRFIATRNELSMRDIGVIFNADPAIMFEPLTDLLNRGAIEILPYYVSEHGNQLTFSAPFQITYTGKTIIEEELTAQKRYNYVEIRAWITLVIAIIALFCSVFDLFITYG